jgi:hypothetical protein
LAASPELLLGRADEVPHLLVPEAGGGLVARARAVDEDRRRVGGGLGGLVLGGGFLVEHDQRHERRDDRRRDARLHLGVHPSLLSEKFQSDVIVRRSETSPGVDGPSLTVFPLTAPMSISAGGDLSSYKI